MSIADQFVNALVGFDASEICLELAVPMVCRWTIPTCDPAFRVPTYQPLCRHDCEVIRDFVCKRPWLEMLELLHLLNIPDEPDCSPLVNTEAGNAPMCVGTIQTGTCMYLCNICAKTTFFTSIPWLLITVHIVVHCCDYQI